LIERDESKRDNKDIRRLKEREREIERGRD
jgi:hypothetical protein